MTYIMISREKVKPFHGQNNKKRRIEKETAATALNTTI